METGRFMYRSVSVVGRGIGQVMFQRRALSGGVMLAGVACHSWRLAVLAVVGTVVGTAVARLSGYDRDEIRAGLYGFNGALVGIAVGVYLKICPATLLLLVVGAALSTWLARAFRCQRRLPGLTAPFILVVWLVLAFCRCFYPDDLLLASPSFSGAEPLFFQSFSLNVGQVMFQDRALSGWLFLAAIWVSSRRQAVYAAIGASVPLLLVGCPGIDLSAWNAGLFGYNGVLCVLASDDGSRRGTVKALFSLLLSIALQAVGLGWGLVTLTAPFVLSVWATGLLFDRVAGSAR